MNVLTLLSVQNCKNKQILLSTCQFALHACISVYQIVNNCIIHVQWGSILVISFRRRSYLPEYRMNTVAIQGEQLNSVTLNLCGVRHTFYRAVNKANCWWVTILQGSFQGFIDYLCTVAVWQRSSWRRYMHEWMNVR